MTTAGGAGKWQDEAAEQKKNAARRRMGEGPEGGRQTRVEHF